MSSDHETPFPDVRVHTFGVDPQDQGNPEKGADVVIKERGCKLILRFDGRKANSPLTEVRLVPEKGTKLDPSKARQFFPQLDLHLAAARAAMNWQFDDVRAAGEELRAIGRPGRGFSDDWFRLIAAHYKALVAEGEPHPTKALAEVHHVTISAASRWITEAKRRGLIDTKEATDAR